MTAERTVFMLAGEPSGDRIGGALMADLASRMNGLRFSGVGGDEMQARGLKSLFPMDDLSVMGFSDVIRRLPLLLWRIRQAARFVARTAPDCVVLIDAQVFSELLARQLRKRGYRGRIVLYVAPSVWAWKPERAPRLRQLFDEVLGVLPFEPRVMEELDGPPTSYVGHPAIERIPEPISRKADGTGCLTLLPGSRAGEIRRHMPVMREVAERSGERPNITGIAIITLPHMQQAIAGEVSGWKVPVQVVSTPAERDEVLARTRLALVTAGTITLELALAGIPMVGTYVPDKRLMHHYEKAGRPMIALPNIIMGERIVPEVPPGDNLVSELARQLELMLDDPAIGERQQAAFTEMRAVMKSGEKGWPRQRAVDRVLAQLDRS